MGQDHYGKVKAQIKVTLCLCTPTNSNQCPYQVVMGRLDQRSINRRRYGTIAFGH